MGAREYFFTLKELVGLMRTRRDLMPRPLDMIDYLGRADPTKGIGACYDDVPYAP